MKRVIPWIVAAGVVALALTFYVRGSQARPKTPAKAASAAPAAAAPAASSAEKIAYTFQDEAQVRGFTELWQKRQSVAVRMAVLKDYWGGEQASVAKFNADLQSQYGFDPAKNYSLDTQQRVLLERKAPEAADTTPGGQAAASSLTVPAPVTTPAATPPLAAGAEAAPAHTFASEDEMKAFATLWQQRQATNIRMAVLQSLWDEQKAELTRVSDTITSTYKLDAAKNYSLDAKRRVLIEHEAPPVPASPPAASQSSASPAAGPTR